MAELKAAMAVPLPAAPRQSVVAQTPEYSLPQAFFALKQNCWIDHYFCV